MSKKILITGTSTGFGKLTAITLAAAGNIVVAGMRGATGKNVAAAKELAAMPNIDVVEMDVTNEDAIQKVVTGMLQKYGKIDVLVNNAGSGGLGLLEGYSIDPVKKMFDVNFYGVLRTYQAVLPAMRKAKSGLIINITSGASGHTVPFMIPYLASKFGVESITEGMQEELKDYGIDNVSIEPGVYPTKMNDANTIGFNADKADIVAAYGDAATAKFNAMGVAFFNKMTAFKMNPQAIADGVLKLVNMENGQRPLRYPLDAIAQGTDLEFINTRAKLKDKWLSNYYN